MPKILVIDDEKAIRFAMRETLENENCAVEEAKDGEEGWNLLQKNEYDLVLCDIKMPRMDGIELLTKVQQAEKNIQFIVMTAHGTIETAVEALKKGAFDFIEKPFDLNRLLISVRNALDKSNLVAETKVLRKKVAKRYEMIGNSAPMLHIKQMIEKVAPTDARVLITGPSGSGKELVAQAIHAGSNRANLPLIEVNCAAIPAELIESELFGHEKGAFTSAVKQRIGKFEQAHQSTLFLDEIGDMSLSAQAKVLRALQEHKITRVGGEKEIKVDVRVIAATNKDLKKEIENGNFREDLYHRLSVILLQVPPLNDRRDDIPLLVEKFLKDIADEYGNSPKQINADAMNYLQSLNWTGNIRELRNVVERLVIMCDSPITKEQAALYVK